MFPAPDKARATERQSLPEKINLAAKLSLFPDHWSPKIVGELNGQQVKLVKMQGAFEFHHHRDEDELFLVLDGGFRMEFLGEDGAVRPVELRAGEMIVVPRGVEHRPVADEECSIMLFEPTGTVNTGNVESERTRRELEKI